MVDLRSFLLVGFALSTFSVQVFGNRSSLLDKTLIDNYFQLLKDENEIKAWWNRLDEIRRSNHSLESEAENATNNASDEIIEGFGDHLEGKGFQHFSPIFDYSCTVESDLTGGTTHWVNVSGEPAEFIVKSGQYFPARRTKVINGTRFGCACTWKTCLPLCCPLGQTLRDEKCVEDLQSATYWQMISTYSHGGPDFFYAVDSYCPMGWITLNASKSVRYGNFVPELNVDRVVDHVFGCVYGESWSRVIPSLRVCLTPPWWAIFCIGCPCGAGIVMLVIFIVYSIVPKLKNLHGLMFRSYVITCIGVYVTTITSIANFAGPHLELIIIEWFVLFFGFSALLWTNSISFDMWRNFRSIRSVDRNNTTKSDLKKYICYALFSWGSLAILISCIIAGVAWIPNGDLTSVSMRWINAGVNLIIYSCTAIMFTLTALTIQKLKKETAGLVGGVNRHSESEQRRFNLFLKLFLITGGHTIMWTIWLCWDTVETTVILCSVELVQSLLIFYFLVWKNNVKQSLFTEVRKLSSRIVQALSLADCTVKYTDQLECKI
ncbi:uncharacterized protein LOC125500352 [Athalia rosae]|uniref:uncharacterized protein LOC125500352 n=1 Tax=Athalia rosae TaxID=37344 RepID=UPI002033B58E|nr:uncharacterized protein LOC125500352 [Athalia rosae]